MAAEVTAWEFSETAFIVGSDPIVCIARCSELRSLMSVREIDAAFGGYASYRQTPWMKRWVGVWGRKNCQRFRRFLRERGAKLTLLRERPPNLHLTRYVTRGTRAKLRSLDPQQQSPKGS